MARRFAQVKLSIWGDDDFRALSPQAQHLYFLLLTQESLSHCGVADWRPKRIAALAAGWTAAEVETAAAELVAALMIVVDEDTEEVLVRSFVRHDELMKQPKMAVAVAKAHDSVASAVLRGVVVHELNRLRAEQPELRAWSANGVGEVLGKASVDPSTYPLGKGSGKDTAKGSGEGSAKGPRKGKPAPSGKGSGKGCPTPAPAPAPSNQHLTDSLRESGAAAPPEQIHAGTIVAEWTAAYEAQVGTKPGGGPRGQVGREARQLLDGGADPPLLVEAARQIGAKGKPFLEREYGPLAARRAPSPDTDINPDDILGPDTWSPPVPPREIEDGPAEQRAEWFAARGRERKAERLDQAKRALAGRPT